MNEGPALRRRDLYPRGVVDGAPAPNGPLGRFRRQVESALTSRSERYEAELERKLRTCPGVTRANVVALMGPSHGVGTTTCTFLAGNVLSAHLKLRVVAVDSDRSAAHLLSRLDDLNTAAELRPYVSVLPSGLHVLSPPGERAAAPELTPQSYGELLAFLGCFYDVVLLDLVTGFTGPLARFVLERSDQVVVVTTPKWAAALVVLDALDHLDRDTTSLVLNKASAGDKGPHAVSLPEDDQLATMLDTSTYTLGALKTATRLPIKELGLSVAERLV